MEEVFLIVAILVYWLFRGVVGGQGQRRHPGGDADSSLGTGPPSAGPPTDAHREAQERALEALRRWEEEQRRRSPAREGAAIAETVRRAPARRTAMRVPAEQGDVGETAARDGFREIARMLGRRLEPARAGPEPAALEEVARPRTPGKAAETVPGTRASRRRQERGAEVTIGEAPAFGRRERETGRAARVLRRIEQQPLLRRAMLYAEVFGPPRGLS